MEEIQHRLIEEEMKQSYIDYAMSVITGRALPDVRDGLKPVHRRILYSMFNMGLLHNKAYAKSARIVGECFKYHPHGDQAVYDALVRMAQDFSLRYPLIQGQGNFGSIEGLPQAAMRYTEARLSILGELLLEDLNKDTVDMIPNFDGSLKEPVLLPSKFPNLLVNGSSGIAVGMATNIPPHNLNEVIDALIALIESPGLEIDDLLKYIKGPDFPTGGLIMGKSGILSTYKKGRGHIQVRAKTEIKDNKIYITEIPYQLNKTNLIQNIAALVRNKRIDGIADIRDESDRKGMSILIELRKGVNVEVILNQLYKLTPMQTTFSAIMIALHDSQPKLLNLKQALVFYLDHRKEIVLRRTQFDLTKAEQRLHILEGLQIALKDLDNVIKLIKKSKDPSTAKQELISKYKLSEIQAQAILDLRLQRLTGLEQEKIKQEADELVKLIKKLKEILASEDKVLAIIKKELLEIKEKYGDERRTKIIDDYEEILTEDLIEEEDVVLTATYSGYIKTTPLTLYKQQKRGGVGIRATSLKEEDVVEHLFITNTHNYLLIFTNKGKVHWIKAYEIPQFSRYSKGKAIINLLNLGKDERINAILPISKFKKGNYLLFATKKGLIKKTPLEDYSHPRKGGIKAINLREGDELVQARLTPGNLEMILATRNGAAVRFREQDVRAMGRTATGVRGVKLKKDDKVVGMEVSMPDATLLTVTENGYGKRTKVEEYRLIKRGGSGVINIQTSERNGKVIGIKTVRDSDEVMLISKNGVTIRMPVQNISTIGRNTQGVRVMRLRENDKVTTIARVIMGGD